MTLVLVVVIVSADSIGRVSFAAPTEQRGAISVAFDDCMRSQYDYAFQLMQARGIVGTFYVITDAIRDFSNSSAFMSIAELQTLQEYGCEIASHSKSHPAFTAISDSQIREECSVSKQVLQSYGFAADNFAYPYGDRNNHTDSIVAEYYRSARSAYTGPYIMQFPISQFLLAGCPGETGDPDVLSYLVRVVDEVYSVNGWAIIFFHNIIPGANNTPYTISSEDFESFLDYVIYRGVATITVNQGLDSPPPPPERPVPDWTNITQDFFTLSPITANPVLTKADITDRTDVTFVADPFLFHEDNTWYMFFEVCSNNSNLDCDIGLATSSDGFHWTYQQVVLDEPFHLAYPQVFKWKGEYYMIPDTYSQNQVKLYKASSFPYTWTFVTNIVSGPGYVDSSIFRYNNTWWLFTSDNWNNTYLYYYDELTDPSVWRAHPMNPIVSGDGSMSRGGGRGTVFNGTTVIRLTQKCDVVYDEAVRAFQVDTLTRTSYAEHEIPQSPLVQASGSGWNKDGMHTVDPWWIGNGWIAAVDGVNYSPSEVWSIGIYVTPLQVTIVPAQVKMYVGQSQTFNSSVTGGASPYTYQWYLNDTAVSDATGSNWTFTPATPGHYEVYLNVTDSLDLEAQSNVVTDIVVYPQLTVSISPVSVDMSVGTSQMFSSAVSGGTPPYTYQWYMNGTAVAGATSSAWAFTPSSAGTYVIYLRVADGFTAVEQSDNATATVGIAVTVVSTQVKMYVGQSQTFSASVSGGAPPYTHQWFLNDTAVPDATGTTWVFTPRSEGFYTVYVNVTDGAGFKGKSNVATVLACSVYLVMTVDSSQGKIARGQSVTVTLDVFNKLDPVFESSLTLTVTGPRNCGYFDVQPIRVPAGTVGKYSFTWAVPNVAGAYTVEVGLVPAQLTVYDAIWLNVT